MIKLTRLPGGGMDVALDDGTDPVGAVATVVYALLYTDQRAPLSREPDHFAARGWWADPEAGSGLWHVRRQGLSEAARAEAVAMVRDALTREPALTGLSVDVVPAQAAQAEGSVSLLQLRITGQHNEREFFLNLSL